MFSKLKISAKNFVRESKDFDFIKSYYEFQGEAVVFVPNIIANRQHIYKTNSTFAPPCILTQDNFIPKNFER
jgi:hypothetical protein